MGSGKTTVGERLATHMGLPMIDTDQYVEKQYGKSVRDIFETEGEEKFRQYEQIGLQQLPTENVIIATGGGIILKPENREWMKQYGFVVYLHCEPALIVERLRTDRSRPLLDGQLEQNIANLFKQRLALYQEADLIIDTSHQDPDEVVTELANMITTE